LTELRDSGLTNPVSATERSFTQQRPWGCRGSLVIDARIKPHHAPPLIEDPEVTVVPGRVLGT